MLVLMAILIFNIAAKQSVVAGLEPVPCINPTKPFIQNFTFQLMINVQGKIIPLDSKIGYDPAQCLREIHTNDQSGRVFIQSSYDKVYTLADFFDVWRKPFNQNQIFNNYTDSYHSISVYQNDQSVNSFENTPLTRNKIIRIIFK